MNARRFFCVMLAICGTSFTAYPVHAIVPLFRHTESLKLHVSMATFTIITASMLNSRINFSSLGFAFTFISKVRSVHRHLFSSGFTCLLSSRSHLHVVRMLRFMSLTQTTGACPLLVISSCVYFCLYGPFSCISFHKFSHPSHSVLSVLFLPYWSFQLHIFL